MATDGAGANTYTFPRNPTTMEFVDSRNRAMVSVYASEPVAVDLPFDDRPIVFVWSNYNFDHVTMSGMVNVFVSGVNSIRYFKLNSIQGVFRNILTSTGWNGPYRIVNAETKFEGDGGKRWGEVKVTIVKADT